MITTVSIATSLALGLSAGKTRNPLKLSVALAATSGIIFLHASFTSGSSWFPTLFFLLFMGGILMMFMILSSILPNELPKNSGLSLMTLPTLIFLMMMSEESTQNNTPLETTKNFLHETWSMEILMALLLLYFFLAVFMLKTEKLPMRAVTCQQKG